MASISVSMTVPSHSCGLVLAHTTGGDGSGVDDATEVTGGTDVGSVVGSIGHIFTILELPAVIDLDATSATDGGSELAGGADGSSVTFGAV